MSENRFQKIDDMHRMAEKETLQVPEKIINLMKKIEVSGPGSLTIQEEKAIQSFHKSWKVRQMYWRSCLAYKEKRARVLNKHRRQSPESLKAGIMNIRASREKEEMAPTLHGEIWRRIKKTFNW